jgi:excisionase family DNA binding protein
VAAAGVVVATLDIDQAAALLKVHPKTLQKLARAGDVTGCKVGRSWVFVERLLIDWLEAQSLSRVSVVDLQENTECRSTDAKTRRTGGSSCRPSVVTRSLYLEALGLPTDAKRRRSTTDLRMSVGSKTGSA